MSSLPPHAASLAPFFKPNGVAIIGASRDPQQAELRRYPQPGRSRARLSRPDLPCQSKSRRDPGAEVLLPDIAAVPDPVELAVLIIPRGWCPEQFKACGQRGIKAAVVIFGSFRELGPEGATATNARWWRSRSATACGSWGRTASA